MALLAAVFLASIRPVENYDFWFHLKLGETIVKNRTLPQTDIFSHSAYGKPVVPYEWLFQAMLYLIFKGWGNFGVQMLVASLAVVYLYFFRRILFEVFHVPLLPRLVLMATLVFFNFDFWVERPQIAAYTLFMIVLYLVLKHFKRGSRWVYLSPLVFWVWTNLHASMVVGLYLFLAFAGTLLFRALIVRNRQDILRARELLVLGIVNAAATILPPLGTKTYRLLAIFIEQREFIAKTIGEWTPLSGATDRAPIYMVLMAAAGMAFLVGLTKNRGQQRMGQLLFLPFLPLGLLVISGIRHTPLALPAILFLFIPLIQLIQRKKFPGWKKFLAPVGAIFVIGYSMALFLYRQNTVGIIHDYPAGAVPFIRRELHGNMFNEYHIGGYLIYRLGPEIKTFIDGRTEMFLPEVFPDLTKLYAVHKRRNGTDEEFWGTFESLTAKYQISWVILTTNRFTSTARLSRLLDSDPNWSLVFFDDTAQIYVKDDGVNSSVLSQFRVTAATPFRKTLYHKNARDAARTEYETIFRLSPSAIAKNALGVMALEDKEYETAKKLFLEALLINPRAAAPNMNLGELAAKDGNFKDAIARYRQAVRDDPQRGLAYLRLGQLMIASGGSPQEARRIWEKGMKATPDEEILERLRQAINDL